MKIQILLLVVGLFLQSAHADSVKIDSFEFNFDKPEYQLTDEMQKSLYQAYRKASAGGTSEALQEVIHPGSYSCQTSNLDKQGFQQFIRKDIGRSIPDNAKVKWFPWKKEFLKAFSMDGLAEFPVEPESILGISFSEKTKDKNGQILKSNGETVLRAVAHASNGQLKIVIPCLTEKGRKVFASKKQ